MGTRGLVVHKEEGNAKAFYNQFDSYPSVLMKELIKLGEDLKNRAKLKEYVEGRAEHNKNMNWDINTDILKDNSDIDYLFHEFVYIVDLDEGEFRAYESEYDAERTSERTQENIKEHKNLGELKLIAKSDLDKLDKARLLQEL